MISMKPGVDLSLLQPQMALATGILAIVYENYFCNLIITSGCEGTHSEGSLHYVGKALDYRTRNIPPGQLDFLVEEAKAALGPQFDVVEESDHLHVEFDPK